MKVRIIAAVIAAMSLCPGVLMNAQESGNKVFDKALELYENGMFERAETIFSNIFSETGDVMAKGYQTLCAVRLQETGNEKMAAEYVSSYPYSKLVSQVHFYNGLNLFDEEDYTGALEAFGQVKTNALVNEQLVEYYFKNAYAKFGNDDLDGAVEGFEKVEKMVYSDYTAPSRYALGYINYTRKNFSTAYDWFEQAGKDPRFKELSDYYMMECRFMQKDYSYVIKNGTKAYKDVPKERQSHLARIISESYLAQGDSEKAKEYYEKVEQSRRDMSREDFFYSGSVLYAVDDFQGAIDNYSLMTDRTDSIGQIANYQLGYSYIQTGNKVAAMDSFKAASEKAYDPEIQEDADFNYAKLSFDLNNNPTVFDSYLAKYGKKRGDQIYSYMALSSLYNHDYSGAVDAYSNIDYLDNDQRANYMRANYLRANQLIQNGSWSDAIPLLKAASYYSDRRENFNQLSKYWLGESYFRSGRYDEAIETFKDLYNLSALDGKTEGRLIPYDIAYSYFRNGDYDNAAKWFDQYLEGRNLTRGEDAAVRRADCDFVRKDYSKAIEGYENAAARYSYDDNLYPFYQSGIAYGLLGDRNSKVKALSKAMDADPKAEYYSETMYELGRAYVAAERKDDAIRTFTTLRDRTDDKTMVARTLIELGMIYRNDSQNDKAIDYYKQVVSEMPGTEYAEDALLAIESIYQTEGRVDEYLDYAEKVGAVKDKTESEKDDMYFAAAEQVFMTENYSRAAVSLNNYMNRYPQGRNIAKADFYMAECCRNLDRKEQAIDWYRKALELGGDSSFADKARLNYAALSYDLERFKDAYSGYTSLLESAKAESDRHAAKVGRMMSAFKAQDFQNAVSSADNVKSDKSSTSAEVRVADYVRAKSYLSMNNRSRAFEIFEKLSAQPSTDEGAEAAFMMIQDAYDQGKYETVESKVYKFSESAGGQSYWLAKAYIVLGDSFAEREEYTQAKATFESIQNGYKPTPGTTDDVLDNVRMRLAKLKNLE